VNEIQVLLSKYKRHVKVSWPIDIAPERRVWFVVYGPAQERRLRLRVGEFEAATRESGLDWRLINLTDEFARWMASHEYREEYFEDPAAIELALVDFADAVVDRVQVELSAVGEDSVVALCGLGSLFGLVRVSELVSRVAPSMRGWLLVFFPGRYDESNYRLLDARDGWNYLAVPITAHS
jgi:hypothetical protein